MDAREGLVFIDTDVFVIDELFENDTRFEDNKAFLESISGERSSTSVYNVLEFCGIIASALKKPVDKFFVEFGEKKRVKVLYPPLVGVNLIFPEFIKAVLERMGRGIRYVDAKILTVAEDHEVEALITWNKKRFADYTQLQVQTPPEYLQSIKKGSN